MKPFPAPSCYYPPWQYKPDKDIGGWYVVQLHPATPSPFYIFAHRPCATTRNPSLAKISRRRKTARCQRNNATSSSFEGPRNCLTVPRIEQPPPSRNPFAGRRSLKEEDGGVDKGFLSIAAFASFNVFKNVLTFNRKDGAGFWKRGDGFMGNYLDYSLV